MKLVPVFARHVTSAFILCGALIIGLNAQPKTIKSTARTIRITLLQLNDVYQISPVDKGKNAGLARVSGAAPEHERQIDGK